MQVSKKAESALFWAGLFLLFSLVAGNGPKAHAQDPAPPFTQCPPAGLDTSCRILIVIEPSGAQRVLTDPNASPTYDGSDDTLIGIVNLSNQPVSSIPITSTQNANPIFAFDGDGICSSVISPNPPGCPFGPTGYEGPGVSYHNISADYTTGTVAFSPALKAKGGSTYFGLEAAIPTTCQDTDGDGLCDDWEINGLYVYVNGNPVFVNLPAMGADPNHKDVFIQTDYMVSPGLCLPLFGCIFGHSHQPTAQAVKIITDAYEKAPVNNPDGTTGIHLHVDCGPSCVMNPVTGQTWGALSEAKALSHQTTLGAASGSNYDWTAFDAIRSANFSEERNQVFHYVVFAHNLGGFGSTSGISRGIPSADLIVSLGSWTNSVGTDMEQGGTLMHELGHNLSLHHGGSDDVNWKPNFLSVMNYYFQTGGLIKNGANGDFDYSRFALPSLNENALNENIGLNGGATGAGFSTYRACPGSKASVLVPSLSGAVDWNCNGTIEASVSADINKDNAKTTLTSFNDWPNVVFTGGAIGGLGLSLTPPTQTVFQQELTPDMDALVPKPYKVIVAGPGVNQLAPGNSIDLTFTVTNAGTKNDSYKLTASSSVTWADLSSVPAMVSLGAGKSQSFTLHAMVPANTPIGAVGNFSVMAVSNGNNLVTDTGSAQLTTRIGTTITITSTPASGFTSGEQLAITATVKPVTGNGIPTGTVSFSSASGGMLYTVTLDKTGTAVLRTAAPPPGTYTLDAAYSGDNQYAGSEAKPVTAQVK